VKTLSLPGYSIHVGGVWASFRGLLQELRPARLAVLVDENTERHCLPLFRRNLPDCSFQLIAIAAGERHKNLETCARIWGAMLEAGLDRHGLLVNLGGGVIGDMGGFCACCYMRGLPFVQFPTTLLAQVDASIGGKLGIDFRGVKNSIGLFADPRAVFIEPAFLQTLPGRELRSGFAEMLKHGLIADASFFEQLSARHPESVEDWEPLLVHSLEIKRRIVEADPLERGLRKALNFGHTVGHAVESFFLETPTPLLHGEAVAAGMIAEAFLSHHRLGLRWEEVERIRSCLLGLYALPPLPVEGFGRLLALMGADKKNVGGEWRFSLLPRLGAVEVDVPVEPEAVTQSLEFYNQSLTSPSSPAG